MLFYDKNFELQDILQKVEPTMLWHPELESESPELMSVLKDFDLSK
jgi:hypothetical protein